MTSDDAANDERNHSDTSNSESQDETEALISEADENNSWIPMKEAHAKARKNR